MERFYCIKFSACFQTYSTGSEHRSWVLFYSLPVLKDVLPTVYYEHYSKFVVALHVLWSDGIVESELANSEEQLKSFYQQYGELYGNERVMVRKVREFNPSYCDVNMAIGNKM